jgi:hypothetical protein
MSLLDTFLDRLEDQAPALARDLAPLSDEARRALGGVVGRFDRQRSGHLGENERRDAIRLLSLLRRPAEAESLEWLNKVLDYLDFNANAVLEKSEFDETMGIFEDFRRVDDNNATLSQIELELLYAVLRHRDQDDSHRLERDERRSLRADLERFESFWPEEVQNNPRVKEILSRRP